MDNREGVQEPKRAHLREMLKRVGLQLGILAVRGLVPTSVARCRRVSSAVTPDDLVRDGRLAEASPGRGGVLRIIGFLSGLFVADVHYRIVEIMIRLALGRDSGGRAKFLTAGSFRLGDALERYDESRRPAVVQLSPVLAREGTDLTDATAVDGLQWLRPRDVRSDNAGRRPPQMRRSRQPKAVGCRGGAGQSLFSDRCEPVGRKEPKSVRALSAQHDHLMSQCEKLELQ